MDGESLTIGQVQIWRDSPRTGAEKKNVTAYLAAVVDPVAALHIRSRCLNFGLRPAVAVSGAAGQLRRVEGRGGGAVERLLGCTVVAACCSVVDELAEAIEADG